jgi:hypothetical protein
MTGSFFATTCNRPRLRDPTHVQEAIGRYWFDWALAVGLGRDESGVYRLTIDGEGWPGAWRVPAHLRYEDFEPDLSRDALPDFEAFLRDIARALAEDLIIQSIGNPDGQFPLAAQEWRIRPGARAIERRSFTRSRPYVLPEVFAETVEPVTV